MSGISIMTVHLPIDVQREILQKDVDLFIKTCSTHGVQVCDVHRDDISIYYLNKYRVNFKDEGDITALIHKRKFPRIPLTPFSVLEVYQKYTRGVTNLIINKRDILLASEGFKLKLDFSGTLRFCFLPLLEDVEFEVCKELPDVFLVPNLSELWIKSGTNLNIPMYTNLNSIYIRSTTNLKLPREMEKLLYLDVTRCGIDKLPELMPNIHTLQYSFTGISLFPKSVPLLGIVTAEGNGIEEIPDEIYTGVTSLNISNNNLSELDLDKFPNLDELDCSRNNFTVPLKRRVLDVFLCDGCPENMIQLVVEVSDGEDDEMDV